MFPSFSQVAREAFVTSRVDFPPTQLDRQAALDAVDLGYALARICAPERYRAPRDMKFLCIKQLYF